MKNLFLASLLPSTLVLSGTLAVLLTGSVVRAEGTAGYEKGFFVASPDGAYKVAIGGRLQARFEAEFPEGEDDVARFSIPRARLTLAGNAFTKALTYKFQADFGKGAVSLKDFYGDYAFVPGWLQLRVGQWKRPFSRQQITSSGSLELVDRSLTDGFFGAGRDIGVAIHNGAPEGFEYALGVFNGTGEKPSFSGAVQVDPATGEGSVSKGKFTNVPTLFHPAIVLRAGFNYGGIKGYSEGDLEGGPLRFAVALSGIADLDAEGADTAGFRGELDYALKVHGFASTGGVYILSNQDGAGMGDQAFGALGFHIQASYVVAGFFQPVVRYALLAPDGDDNDVHEILGGLSFYLFKHGLKVQVDGGAILREAAGGSMQKEYLGRVQAQVAF